MNEGPLKASVLLQYKLETLLQNAADIGSSTAVGLWHSTSHLQDFGIQTNCLQVQTCGIHPFIRHRSGLGADRGRPEVT